MGIFKRAAVRGICHELIRTKRAAFPDQESADAASDAVADKAPEAQAMPEVSPEGGHSPETVVAIANRLMEIAAELMKSVQGGAEAPAGGAPEAGGPPPDVGALAAKEGAEQLFKTAAAADYETVASDQAVALMDKAAEETKAAGNLITGGDKGNDAHQAAKLTDVGALDQQQRPEGTYHHGAGKTEFHSEQGAIGDLAKHDKEPKETPPGSNSLTESKKAALNERIAKIAGALIHGGDKHNTPAQAASTTEVGKLDQKQRPEGYAHVGQGNANFKEPQAARIGKEEKHPNGPSNTPAGTNSVIEASKAAGDLSAEDQAYVAVFSKCAADVGAYLPTTMTDDTKVAAIRHMMGMDHDERQTYIDELVKSAAADEEKKKHMAHEAKETPAEEKKEEAKKEGALMEQIRKIASAAK